MLYKPKQLETFLFCFELHARKVKCRDLHIHKAITRHIRVEFGRDVFDLDPRIKGMDWER